MQGAGILTYLRFERIANLVSTRERMRLVTIAIEEPKGFEGGFGRSGERFDHS